MADANTWMPLYIGDYLADTMHLSGSEHGAYLLLIMHYWRTGPLADDDKSLAAIARTDRKTWASDIGPVIRSFFQAKGGRLCHKRIDRERANATSNSEQRREAGRVAGRASAAKRAEQRKANDNATDRSTDSQRKPNDRSTIGSTNVERSVNQTSTPSPSPVKKEAKQQIQTQSPRGLNGHRPGPERPEPTAENGFNGWAGDREAVGGFYWDEVWPRITDAARLDLASWTGDEIPARRWMMEIRDPDVIVRAISKIAERDGYQPPRSLSYFDKPVREAHARKA